MPPVCVWVLSALWSYDWIVHRDQQHTPYHSYSWPVLHFLLLIIFLPQFHAGAHLPRRAGIETVHLLVFGFICEHTNQSPIVINPLTHTHTHCQYS